MVTAGQRWAAEAEGIFSKAVPPSCRTAYCSGVPEDRAPRSRGPLTTGMYDVVSELQIVPAWRNRHLTSAVGLFIRHNSIAAGGGSVCPRISRGPDCVSMTVSRLSMTECHQSSAAVTERLDDGELHQGRLQTPVDGRAEHLVQKAVQQPGGTDRRSVRGTGQTGHIATSRPAAAAAAAITTRRRPVRPLTCRCTKNTFARVYCASACEYSMKV